MAKGGVVHYELTADETKAVDAFRSLSKEQQKAALQFTRTAQASDKFDSAVRRSGSASRKSASAVGTLTKSLKTFATTAIGGYGVSRIIGNMAASMSEAADRAVTFEREMTGLLSLGKNAENTRAVKDEVLDLSIAYRTATGDVADFLFALQSGTYGMDKTIVGELRDEALELAEVSGATLPTAMLAMTKAMQIYGDEVDSVDQAQNKLFMTAEAGQMTMEQLGTLFPDVANSAKTFGYSLDEVLGTLSVATRVGGKTEKTFTGVRNVFSRMGNAVEENISITGDLVTDLQTLQGLEPDVLKRIFGEEAIGVVASLVENVAQLKTEIEDIASIEEDIVQKRLETRMQDPAYRLATQLEMTRKAAETAVLRGGGTAAAQAATLAWEEEEAGYKLVTPTWMHWFAKPAAAVGAGLRAVTGRGLYSQFAQAEVASAMQAAGKQQRALEYIMERTGGRGFSFPQEIATSNVYGGVPVNVPGGIAGPVYREQSVPLVRSKYSESQIAEYAEMQRKAAVEMQEAADKWNRALEAIGATRRVPLNAGA